ncbi:MAG TPA: hypothetical protein VFF05_05570 [Rudaea sp.]|nr:hypothetical protein [Rudaea sp.]
MADALSELIDRCCTADDNMSCPLIARLQFESEDSSPRCSRRAGG